jgi:glucokinase
LPALLRDSNVAGIGVGFGGPVDWKTGKISRSHQIEGWSEFDLNGWLTTQSGLKVAVENDGNVAALGEAIHGAGKNFNPVFYTTLGSGVGGGLVLNGKIYHGATPGEAEIGHVRLDRTGTTVESRCSGWAVDQRIRKLKTTNPDSVLVHLAQADTRGEARHLSEALKQADPVARNLLAEIAQDLAFAFSHVVHLFHPEIIVIGGGLARVGEPLRLEIQNQLPKFLMEVFLPGPKISLAALGDDTVPIGALELIRSTTA